MPNDARPAEGGVGCFLFGVLVGVAFAVYTWVTQDQPGGFVGLLGLLAMCGFLGALAAVGSETNAAKRERRRR